MGLAEQIAALPPDLQQEVADFVGYLVEKRARQERCDKVERSLQAAEGFHGLGAEIWQGVDPDEYVRELRADW
jgi:hypothetical protein